MTVSFRYSIERLQVQFAGLNEATDIKVLLLVVMVNAGEESGQKRRGDYWGRGGEVGADTSGVESGFLSPDVTTSRQRAGWMEVIWSC